MNLRVNTKKVKISELRANTWNPKVSPQDDFDIQQQYDEVVKSIKNYGLVDPILVRSARNKKKLGYYEIINGYHRFLACKELGFDEVIINDLGDVDDQKAKKLTIITEEIKIPVDQTKLSVLLKEMLESEDLSALSDDLPYSKELIQSKIELLDFKIDEVDIEGSEQVIEDEEVFDSRDNVINMVFETSQDKAIVEKFLNNLMKEHNTPNFAVALLELIKEYGKKDKKAV